MKVSVLLPTFNRGSAMGMSKSPLEKSIQSFLDQDYKNAELIILNDGSTDDSIHIIRYYATLSKRIKVFDYLTSFGPPKNMNFLWDQADGDLICQLHDDDELTHDSISLRVKEFEKNPELQVVYGGVFTNNLNGTDEMLRPGEPADDLRITKEEYINFTTLMYRRDLPFRFDSDLRYYFDWLFKIRCLNECLTGYIKEPVMYYTVHHGQESNKCRREGMNEPEEKIMRNKLKELWLS